VRDEAHADADGAEKALGRQGALFVLAPPSQQCRKNTDVGEGIEHEDEPGTHRRDEDTRDGRSDRARPVNGHAVERDGGRQLIDRNELGDNCRPRRQHQCAAYAECKSESEQDPGRRPFHQGHDPERAGDNQHIDLNGDQQPSAIDDVGKRSGREREQHQRKTVCGLDQRHHRR
jgi:hypothetical protein